MYPHPAVFVHRMIHAVGRRCRPVQSSRPLRIKTAQTSCPLLCYPRSVFAVLPKRATVGSAGYDLSSVQEGTVPPLGGQSLFRTGWSMSFPPGTYGSIRSRSGLAVKHGIHVGAGVIDPDYKGEVQVLLINHSTQPFRVSRGQRIAQLILESYHHANCTEVIDANAVQPTQELGPSMVASPAKGWLAAGTSPAGGRLVDQPSAGLTPDPACHSKAERGSNGFGSTGQH